MRVTALIFSLALILFSFGSVVGQGIYVDHVDGLDDPDAGEFSSGATLTFHMRVVGDGTPHYMLNNGFIFSSADCTWGALSGEYNPLLPIASWFDFVKVINHWGSGSIEDTLGIGLLSLFGTGLPAGFDDIMYTFTMGPIDGPDGATLTVDSSWYPPSNPWMWDVVGEEVAWGGPYTYSIPDGGDPCAGGAGTYCTPQPTILKSIDRVLDVHITCEDVNNVDLASIRVGNIPPYNPAIISGDEVITYAFIFRFLGASGFRPVTGDFEATYTVYYNYKDGSAATPLVGDYALQVYPGDVTLDGNCTMDDLIFAADYFWRDGGVPGLADDAGKFWDAPELLDVNQDGYTDPRDVLAIHDLLGI